MLLRDYGTMRLARRAGRPRSATRSNGYPLVERVAPPSTPSKELFREHWPTSADGLSAGRQGAEARHAVHQPEDGRDLRAHPARRRESGGGDREAEIERARKVWSQGFVAEAIDKFCRTQEVMDISGRRIAACSPAHDMAKWQADHRGADHLRLRPLHGAASRAVDARGRVLLQQLALLKGFDLDGIDPVGPDFIHLSGRVRQARLRRPRDVLRRSEVRRGADRDAAVGRLQRRAPQADRRQGLAGAAAGHASTGFGKTMALRSGRRARVGAMAARASRRSAAFRGRTTGRSPMRSPRRRRSAKMGARARRHRAFRHHRHGRQHGDRRRRPAAGCSPRR